MFLFFCILSTSSFGTTGCLWNEKSKVNNVSTSLDEMKVSTPPSFAEFLLLPIGKQNSFLPRISHKCPCWMASPSLWCLSIGDWERALIDRKNLLQTWTTHPAISLIWRRRALFYPIPSLFASRLLISVYNPYLLIRVVVQGKHSTFLNHARASVSVSPNSGSIFIMEGTIPRGWGEPLYNTNIKEEKEIGNSTPRLFFIYLCDTFVSLWRQSVQESVDQRQVGALPHQPRSGHHQGHRLTTPRRRHRRSRRITQQKGTPHVIITSEWLPGSIIKSLKGRLSNSPVISLLLQLWNANILNGNLPSGIRQFTNIWLTRIPLYGHFSRLILFLSLSVSFVYFWSVFCSQHESQKCRKRKKTN